MQGSFGKTPHEKTKSVCAVCLESCSDTPVQALPCGHVFHASCIAAWVNMCYRQQAWCTCPLCKDFFAIVSTACTPFGEGFTLSDEKYRKGALKFDLDQSLRGTPLASQYTHQRRQGHKHRYQQEWQHQYQLVSFASPAVPLTWTMCALLWSKQGVFPEGKHGGVHEGVHASDDSEEEYSEYEL